jgi:UDP-N-acetylmuramoyl-L-alanyl-D-glutamate--2,6-diaminopimelate ligase
MTIPKVAVVNADDPSADYYASKKADIVVRYSIENDSDFKATDIRFEPGKTYFRVNGEAYFTPLAGAFNIYNCLAAIALTRTYGVNLAVVQTGLSMVKAVSGRMERIEAGQNFTAIVDFAHTPNALKMALQAARTMLPEGKRLIAVFGSAGLRDVEKRRMMAETSAEYADFTVLTAEDPRTESLDAILQMMADGCISKGGVEGKTFIRIGDRGEAIYQACQMAQPGDIVIACGKGHEQSMCFGTIEYPWDDRDAMRVALQGTPLKTLPTAVQ